MVGVPAVSELPVFTQTDIYGAYSVSPSFQRILSVSNSVGDEAF